MSKFDYASFYGGYDNLAVSKERYTKEQAIEIAKRELISARDLCGKTVFLAICDAYVRHRAGMNEDHEPCVGWWLEYAEHKRCCPVWAFHLTPNDKETMCKHYEYIQLKLRFNGGINEQ